jgi:hypothetical protein
VVIGSAPYGVSGGLPQLARDFDSGNARTFLRRHDLTGWFGGAVVKTPVWSTDFDPDCPGNASVISHG